MIEQGLTYHLLTESEDVLQATALFAASRGSAEEVAPGRPAGILLGASEAGKLLGAAASHRAPDDRSPARVEGDLLHVTEVAVEPAAVHRGIGGGLMRLQRLVAMQQGLRLVAWSADPFDGRVAHLAIHKLGAVSRALHATAGTLDVEWWVSSPRVRSRLAGDRPELDLAHALEAGAPKLNAGRLDDEGLLRPTGGDSVPESATALVEVPHEFKTLEARAPSLAAEWRAHLARILSGAFAKGYWLTDYLWLRGERIPRAYYLLIDGERTLS